jgi:hypothetical protein
MYKDVDDKQKSRQEELDDFWDISSLAPHSKNDRTQSMRRFDTSVTEIELPEKAKSTLPLTQAPTDVKKTVVSEHNAETVHRLPPRAGSVPAPSKAPVQAPTPDPIVYAPQHPLIEQVTILPWRTHFPYYERFCQMSRDLFGHKGEKCDPVSFFSYMPQYDQMNRAQLAWYLYFRDLIRKGEYPRTEHSYIFLLLFEIINLPDLIPPTKGIELLCRIWIDYREDYPLLDRYVCEWICDYCLLHRLPVPAAHLGDEMRKLLSVAQLREFYVHHNADQTERDDAFVYLECCSNYDYKKSRVYQSSKQAAEVFDLHIPQALSAVLRSITQDNSLFSQIKMQTTTVTRDTFVGALCSHRVKNKIEVRYRSFSRSHELRFFITDVIKYAENKLRQVLGYKSKLSIYALPDPIKVILNGYFAQAFPKSTGKTPEAVVRPEYEKLYDLPNTEMSAKEAARIEQASWTTTQRLVDAFEEQFEEPADELLVPMDSKADHDDEPIANQRVTAEAPLTAAQTEENSLESALQQFLRFAIKQEAQGQLAFCRSIGKMPETMADALNELAVDIWGDILLEEGDGGAFFVIDDYLEQAQALLNQAE